LKNLASQFTKIGIYCGIAVLIILIVMTVVVGANATQLSATGLVIAALPQHLNLVVVLIVVAIPEGLPITIQIAIAFSVLRMHKQDQILVRRSDALEKIAEVDELIVGKTSVITKNQMKVKKFFLEQRPYDNNRNDTFFNCELNELTLKLVQEGIIYNNSAYVEMGDTKYIPVGDGTEVGFLKFLQNADIPVHTRIKDRFEKVVAQLPKSSEAGKQFSACAVDEGDNQINLHIKGAPEAILAMSSSICGVGGAIEVFPVRAEDGNVRQQVEECVDEMGQSKLRVIAFAHADMAKSTWEEQLAENAGCSPNEVLNKILTGGPQAWLDIKLVGAFGLRDKARPMVKSAIKHSAEAGITVRMISGDSKKTAEAVALEVGLINQADILSKQDLLDVSPNDKRQYVIMDARDFDAEVGDDLEKPAKWAKFQ
jgi:Ca2+-transporting ATPase